MNLFAQHRWGLVKINSSLKMKGRVSQENFVIQEKNEKKGNDFY